MLNLINKWAEISKGNGLEPHYCSAKCMTERNVYGRVFSEKTCIKRHYDELRYYEWS